MLCPYPPPPITIFMSLRSGFFSAGQDFFKEFPSPQFKKYKMRYYVPERCGSFLHVTVGFAVSKTVKELF